MVCTVTDSRLDPIASRPDPIVRMWLHRLLQLVCLASFLTGASLAYMHLSDKEKTDHAAKSRLQNLTVKAAEQIGVILKQAIQSAETLAEDLTQARVTRETMLPSLREMLTGNPNYFGGTITFAPYGYDPKVRLHSSYLSKSGAKGALEYLQIANLYDYTQPKYDWYGVAMARGNRWGEPYWDEAGKTYMTTYSAVFYATDPASGRKVPNGVVTIDISMSQIKNIIEALDIGASGFGALTTRDGNYLYHPNHDYVQGHLNIRDVARQKNDPDRLQVAKMAANGQRGIIDHISTTTGEASWLIIEPVPVSGWSLQNTFIKDDLDIDVDSRRQRIIWILISAMVFIALLAAWVLKVHLDSPVRIWILTAIISLLLVAGVSLIWDLALTYHASGKTVGVKVSDKATLRTVMNTYQKTSADRKLIPPIFIPTGLYIDSTEFNISNNILVTGRLWQKYSRDYPEKLAKGIQFGRAKSVRIEKIASYPVENGEVLQWSFQAELRQPLDYSRYPLEVGLLSMQILPLATDQNIVLVPDLDAYKLTTATLLPGLDKAVFLPGWKLVETFFVLRPTQRDTDFGIKRNFDQETLPTLYYEIGIKRIFIDAFISNLTPLIIVAIVLFGLVLVCSQIEVGRVMSICVAVFFVVVFSHLDIRKNISIGEIFYLEYFFFVIYLAIIVVPMDAFRITLRIPSRFFEFQNGLLGKVIYWPIILGAFFVITALKFY
jgi:hypothetical protein